jgi:hypothetical protein
VIWIFLAFGANFISCWIRIRIQETNRMQIHADPDPKHCLYHSSIVRKPGSSLRFLAGSRSVLKGTVAPVWVWPKVVRYIWKRTKNGEEPLIVLNYSVMSPIFHSDNKSAVLEEIDRECLKYVKTRWATCWEGLQVCTFIWEFPKVYPLLCKRCQKGLQYSWGISLRVASTLSYCSISLPRAFRRISQCLSAKIQAFS